MSDPSPPMPPDPSPTDDGRDDAIAAALAVAPLDGATRRRLVRIALRAADDTAVDEGSGGRFGRLAAVVGIAATLVIGAVVGAVIVTRPSDPSTTTAARAPEAADEKAASTAPGAASDAEAAAPAPESVGAPPRDLGELGRVRGLRELRAAVNRVLASGNPRTLGSVPVIPCASLPAGAAGAYGLIQINAVGTANLDEKAVVILVGPTPAGDSVAAILDPLRGCEYINNVRL